MVRSSLGRRRRPASPPSPLSNIWRGGIVGGAGVTGQGEQPGRLQGGAAFTLTPALSQGERGLDSRLRGNDGVMEWE